MKVILVEFITPLILVFRDWNAAVDGSMALTLSLRYS